MRGDGRFLHDVFAVVEEHEVFRGQGFGHYRDVIAFGGQRDAERRGDGACDERAARERSEFHQPDAVGPRVAQGQARLDGGAGLAHPARAHDRDQTSLGQLRGDLVEFAFASDERGQARHEVGGAGREAHLACGAPTVGCDLEFVLRGR